MNYGSNPQTERHGWRRIAVTFMALCLPVIVATIFSGSFFKLGESTAMAGMDGMSGMAHAAMGAASDPNQVAEGAQVITLSDTGFSPANVTVNSGTSIAWVNNSTTSRSIQVTQPIFFGSAVLQKGNTFQYLFAEAGTYPYRTADGAFAGTVTVKAASTSKTVSTNGTTAGCSSTGTSNISVTSTGFSPDNIHVDPGTSVIWTNNSGDRARIRDINHNLFDSDDLDNGQTFTYIFCDNGSYQYENARADGDPTGVVTVGFIGGTATPTPTGTVTPGATTTPGQVVNIYAQRHDTFFPNDVTIGTGTTVRFTNQDDEQHTSTSDTGVWNSGALNQGQFFEYTFNTPGTYDFSCLFHLGEMTGIIRVTGNPITPTPGSPTATPTIPAGNNVDVSIQNYAFAPQNLTILVGTTVKWTNLDADAHTSTSDTGVWNSGSLSQGGTFSYTFNTPGTYAYHCGIHPGMTGTITVVASLPTGTPPTAVPTNTTQPSATSQPSTTAQPSTTLTVLPTNTPGAPVDVSISGFAFTPQNLTVQVGTIVKWTNHDSTPHTVTGANGAFASGNLQQNATYSFTFTTPGTYNYACSYHSGMTGSITVTNVGPTATSQPSVTGTAQATGTSQATGTTTVQPTSTTAQPSATSGQPTATRTAQPTPGTVDVAIQGYAFSPITVTVQVGTTVKWTNLDNDMHSVTEVGGLFDSGAFALNGTYSYTFNTPGTYEYYCTVHGAFMTGWVVVEAGNSCDTGFVDVPAGSTFYEFVQCLTCQGILGGYPDGTFRPSNTVTRGQLAKIVSNAAGWNETPAGQTFSDVPSTDTFYVFVERAMMHGIINGYPDGTFRPGNNASRGQISKIVSNAAGYTDTVTTETFADVPAGSTFYLFVERLATRTIMSGYACGGTGEPCGAGNKPYFRPSNDATRGQVAEIVSNTFFPNCTP